MIKTGNENIQDMNKQIASLTQELEEARKESKLKDVYLHNLCHEFPHQCHKAYVRGKHRTALLA